MKANMLFFARIGLTILVGGSVVGSVETRANAQVNLSVDLEIQSPGDFYSPLAPYGSWVDIGHYGRCWHPASVAAGWRPYTIGNWEYTDCGWYWASDEPWAWACYHYGSWILDPSNGWVWVPGTQWAPAWVVWRQAPDYIGWAPCGPGGVAAPDSLFAFVDVHHFHDRLRPQQLVFNDSVVLRRSHPVGGFRTETHDFNGTNRRIALNQGPSIDPIQKATKTRFTQRPVTELVKQTTVPEAARRSLTQPRSEKPRQAVTQPAPARTGREEPRLYREAPAQPAPTGRQEQRLYREVPNPQPEPKPQPPIQPPARNPVPEVSRPATTVQRPLTPTGRESGATHTQEPRREEPQQRAAPTPPAHPAPAAPKAPAPEHEKQKDRPGE